MATRTNHLYNTIFDRLIGPDRIVLSAQSRTKVVMMHAGRSGSTVLGDLLNQHDMIFWDGEIFNGPGLRPYRGAKMYVWQKWPRSKFFPSKPFDFIANRCTVSNEPVFGFEMKYFDMRVNEIDVATFANRLFDLEINHVINLHRKNHLRWLVSQLVAMQRSKFHFKNGEKAELDAVTINIDSPYKVVYRSDYLSMFELFERIEREAREFGNALRAKKVLNLTFEDHIEKDPTEAYRLVCEFLNLPIRDVRIRYSRATPYALRDVVTNFHELKERMTGTKYEWMLKDE